MCKYSYCRKLFCRNTKARESNNKMFVAIDACDSNISLYSLVSESKFGTNWNKLKKFYAIVKTIEITASRSDCIRDIFALSFLLFQIFHTKCHPKHCAFRIPQLLSIRAFSYITFNQFLRVLWLNFQGKCQISDHSHNLRMTTSCFSLSVVRTVQLIYS